MTTRRASVSPLPGNVRLLGWASFLNDVASEMVYPLLPQFLITVLGGNRFHLGLIEGVADSASSLLRLWAGMWSDRLGRRRVFVVLGYALAAAARPVIGLATVPWHLLTARAADRLGKGLRTAPRDALIAISAPRELHGRAFGFHRAMDHLGAAVGPMLAAAWLLIWPDQLRALFLATLVPGVLVVVLLLARLREAPVGEARVETAGSSAAKLSPSLRWFLAALIVFTLGNSSDAFLLLRARELGVAVPLLPLLWLAFHVVKSAGNLWLGRLVDRVGPRGPLLAGWLLYAAVYVAFALATEAWHAWALFLVYAVFYALSEPAEKTLVARLGGARAQGRAFGWFNAALGVSALPASLIFGGLYEQLGPQAAFAFGAALALLAVCLLGLVRE
jgi:MFS family permease